MMAKYDELDSMIIKRIAKSRCSFSYIFRGDVKKACDDNFRILDRRLQALRKKGLICWIDGGWFVVDGNWLNSPSAENA